MRTSMSRLIPILTVAGLALTTVVAPPSYADGGTRPSNAPTITPGVEVTGGATGSGGSWHGEVDTPMNQFYKIPLKFGDQLRIDFENIVRDDDLGTYLCILDPSVTDFTVGDANCIKEYDTDALSQLKFTAPKTGDYLLSVSKYCGILCDSDSWAYSLTTSIRHRTTLTLSGPRTAHEGQTVTLRGVLSPGAKRTLTLLVKSQAHDWQPSGHPTTNGDGRFTATYHLGSVGQHWFKVVYKGNRDYLPSSRTISMNVT